MRPLFPKDYRNDVTLNNLVMSVDPDANPEVVAMLGSAISVCISDIPFDGPISATQVGLVDGKLCFNPTAEEKEKALAYVMPKMIVGGFTTVTIASVVFAGIIAPLIF